MEEYYQSKPKSPEKTTYAITKDAIIDQLKVQIQEQTATIELLKQQLTIIHFAHYADESITSNR